MCTSTNRKTERKTKWTKKKGGGKKKNPRRVAAAINSCAAAPAFCLSIEAAAACFDEHTPIGGKVRSGQHAQAGGDSGQPSLRCCDGSYVWVN